MKDFIKVADIYLEPYFILWRLADQGVVRGSANKQAQVRETV